MRNSDVSLASEPLDVHESCTWSDVLLTARLDNPCVTVWVLRKGTYSPSSSEALISVPDWSRNSISLMLWDFAAHCSNMMRLVDGFLRPKNGQTREPT